MSQFWRSGSVYSDYTADVGEVIIRGRSRVGNSSKFPNVPNSGGVVQPTFLQWDVVFHGIIVRLSAPGDFFWKKKEPCHDLRDRAQKGSGSYLLSHTVSHAVPSAPEGLTSVFGMGTGVAPPTLPPDFSS